LIAELFDIDPDELISQIITNNANDNKLIRMMKSPVMNAA
jgi:hypothetical protein